MKVIPVQAGTSQWFAARSGIPTASRFEQILTPGGKLSTSSRKYAYKLVAERLLNESMQDVAQTEWMVRGKEQEPNAIAQFQFVHELALEPVGFITTNDGRAGASPDAHIVDTKQFAEIKCPSPWVHLGYLLDGPGTDYRPQVQGQMWICEAEAIHFFSWHPQMPAAHIVVKRDDAYIALLARAVTDFCDQCDEMEHRARTLGHYLPSRIALTPDDVERQPEPRPDAVIEEA